MPTDVTKSKGFWGPEDEAFEMATISGRYI